MKLLLGAGFVFLVGFLLLPRLESVLRVQSTVSYTPVPQHEVRLSIFPAAPIQGDPLLVQITGTSSAAIQAVTIGSSTLAVFPYRGAYVSLYGIDLNARAGTSTVLVQLTDGSSFSKQFAIGKRPRATAPLGIPAKLGGNTPASAARLVSNLGDENAVLNSVPSQEKVLWDGPFIIPLASTIVTDGYGYSRLTQNYSIAHKGTDFRAAIGTPVMAMNSGTIKLAREFRIYGKTIVIDHGFGLQTLYMHLSRLDVVPGDRIERAEIIGLSGSSGYAESPHLHISVKIGGISIDPEVFLSFFTDAIRQ